MLILYRFPQLPQVSTTDEPMTTDDTGLDATFVSQHALRQAELSRQLQELTKALAMKEELAKKMVDSDKGMNALRKQYEVGYISQALPFVSISSVTE